jgi:hypothetical protein
MFKNMGLKRIFEPNRDEVMENAASLCSIKCYLEGHIKDEMGRKRSTYGRNEKCVIEE